jgi:hypothetical protein
VFPLPVRFPRVSWTPAARQLLPDDIALIWVNESEQHTSEYGIGRAKVGTTRGWPIPSLRFFSAWIWRWQAGGRRFDGNVPLTLLVCNN